MDKIKLLSDLKRDEGFRPYLYDDSTGKELIKGDKIVGNPTIGYGWCVSTDLCSEELGELILNYQVTDVWGELIKDLPWLEQSPDVIQRSLCNMAFNLGVPGLLKFNTFLGLIKDGKYDEAADDLMGTLWFKQVKTRGSRIQQAIRNAQHI